jgi:hypothetical protein
MLLVPVKIDTTAREVSRRQINDKPAGSALISRGSAKHCDCALPVMYQAERYRLDATTAL